MPSAQLLRKSVEVLPDKLVATFLIFIFNFHFLIFIFHIELGGMFLNPPLYMRFFHIELGGMFSCLPLYGAAGFHGIYKELGGMFFNPPLYAGLNCALSDVCILIYIHIKSSVASFHAFLCICVCVCECAMCYVCVCAAAHATNIPCAFIVALCQSLCAIICVRAFQ